MRKHAIVAAFAVLTSLAVPARAADVPAYGTITIANYGVTPVVSSTYDPLLWSCTTIVHGDFAAPVSIAYQCVPNQDASFSCPLMILSVRTSGLAARAAGRATCTTMLDTGEVDGPHGGGVVFGDLGHAGAVTCMAYVDSLVLVPPYQVTCDEPGLPGT